MRLRPNLDLGPKRGRKASELIRRVEDQAMDEISPRDFVDGRDREYLNHLIQKPRLSEAELEVLSRSWWIEAVDPTYSQGLSQVPGLEDYIWSEVMRFRDMNLKPFGEEKRLNELEPERAAQVAITYGDGQKLFSMFPESTHLKELRGFLKKEKPTFLKLLETNIGLTEKLAIAFVLIRMEPAHRATVIGKISVHEVRQELESQTNEEFLLITYFLFPELAPEVRIAYQRIQETQKEKISALRKQRLSSPANFSSYLQDAFPYISLTADEVGMKEDGSLYINLPAKTLNTNPTLPERPSL